MSMFEAAMLNEFRETGRIAGFGSMSSAVWTEWARERVGCVSSSPSDSALVASTSGRSVLTRAEPKAHPTASRQRGRNRMSDATASYVCACCKGEFIARTADRKRGWARFCSKSCKAKKQEARTGQHAAHHYRQRAQEFGGSRMFDPGDDEDVPRAMSLEELAMGGYGDADWDTSFHDGKL